MRFLAVMLLGLAMSVPAQGQAPQGLVDRNFYDGRTPRLDQTIRFCIVSNSPLHDLDRAVAEAIGEVLLVQAETFDLDLNIVQNAVERDRVLFINLTDNCDAVMGTNLAWRSLPEWLTVSRSYYNAPHMLAVRAGTYGRLDEIPFGKAVGVALFSVVDQQFTSYLGTLPPERRWFRLPYDDIPTMLADIRAGIVEGGLLPSPLAGTESNPDLDGLDMVPTAPLRIEPMQLGALLLSNDTFIRTALDQAIEALQADGTIDRILAEKGFPAQVGF
ncbi:MAG: transporter substrate-binding domain-containing protein [Bauldia sp.]|nr:transporter substrate-binding domain-containing protein [Bauldia sp.]